MFCPPVDPNTYFFRPIFNIFFLGLFIYLSFRKIHAETICFFITFFVDKKQLLKAILTGTFIRVLMNCFDLPLSTVQNRVKDTH